MTPDPRVPLKNPWIAGLLAFLVPGGGHFYQGRHFKGALYLVCILGTFFYGMCLGDWQAVHYRPTTGRLSLSYLAQVGTGVVAFPAYFQARRVQHPDNTESYVLDAPLQAPFQGQIVGDDRDGAQPIAIAGDVDLKPVAGPHGITLISGTFRGTTTDGKAVTVPLAGDDFRLDRPIGSSPWRSLRVSVEETADVPGLKQAVALQGAIPRSLANWYEVPPTGEELERLHERLGKFYDLALVFTWIAGLLNILAFWDAVEGPAYGYGDKEPDTSAPAGESTPSRATQSTESREPVTTASSLYKN